MADLAPLHGGRGPIVAGTAFDLAGVGYRADEFTVAGTAIAYRRVAGAGTGGLETVEEVPYTTRVLVHRPVDPASFDGTVYVEWLNVSGGLDAAPTWTFTHREIIRRGSAWVGVSAQQVGVTGGTGSIGMSTPGLMGSDPGRYGRLGHPGDRFSYDIFTQAGRAVRDHGEELLGGPAARSLIAVGESQSAFRLTTYINDVDPRDVVYDGFLVHARGGTGAPLDDKGDPAAELQGDPVRFAYPRVPVLCVESETDLVSLRYLEARQDDDANFVLWEMAGTSHSDVYLVLAGMWDDGRRPIEELAKSWRPVRDIFGIMKMDRLINAGQQHYVMDAAISAIDRWACTGERPAAAERIRMADDGFATDEHGNVLGGIRTPSVEAPTAVLSGLGNSGNEVALLSGTTEPFDAGRLARLFGSKAAYRSRVEDAVAAAVKAGHVLEADAQEIADISEINYGS